MRVLSDKSLTETLKYSLPWLYTLTMSVTSFFYEPPFVTLNLSFDSDMSSSLAPIVESALMSSEPGEKFLLSEFIYEGKIWMTP